MFSLMSPQITGTTDVLIENLRLISSLSKSLDRISFCHAAQAAGDASHVCQCLYQAGLTGTTVSQNHHVTNSVCCVHFHTIFLQY